MLVAVAFGGFRLKPLGALFDEDIFLGRGDSFSCSAPAGDITGGGTVVVGLGCWSARLPEHGLAAAAAAVGRRSVVRVLLAVRLSMAAAGELLLLKMN